MRRIQWLPLLLVVGLAGCQQGENANTSLQDATTGNGVELTAGDLQVAAVTLVAGDEASGTAAVTAVVVNSTTAPDRLEAITVGGIPANLTPGPIDVPPMSSLAIATKGQVSAEVTGLGAEAGAFVGVSFRFDRNGIAAGDALVVPPVGFYRGSAPSGFTPQPSASRTPVPDGH